MGSLRAFVIDQRTVHERRGESIGTFDFRSQWKRGCFLVFGCALTLGVAIPGVARAEEPASLPLPPPPPAPASSEPLPAPPPPRAGPIPATTAASAARPGVSSRPGAPGSDLPALPPAPRGVRYHDGFYLRMGLGAGFGGALVSSDSKSIGDYSFGGGGGALDLWIGGTPTPGFAMGGVLSVLGINSTERRVSGKSIASDVSGSSGLIGYFVDVFPDPEGGFHFGGALGLASANAKINDGPKEFQGGGLGLEAWAGYDFWVGSQWSLGGTARFIGTVTREKDDATNVSSETSLGAGTLSFTALYH